MLNHKKILILIFSFILVLTACGKENSNETVQNGSIEIQKPKESKQETVEVQLGTYEHVKIGVAEIEYTNTQAFVWTQEDTYYKEVFVKEGQAVKKGDTLATFDVDVSESELEEQKLQLARKIAEVEEQKNQYLSAIAKSEEGLQGLTSHELEIAKLKIEKIRINYERYVYQAEPQIVALQEAVDQMEAKKANNQIVAPFDGVIDLVVEEAQKYYPGLPVTIGATLFRMHSTEEFIITIKEKPSELQYNMDITLILKNLDQTTEITGKIVSDPSILPTDIRLDGEMRVKIDQKIPAELQDSKRWDFQCKIRDIPNVILVDNKVISEEKEVIIDGAEVVAEFNKYFVYVLEDGVKKKRYIEKGFSNQDEVVWILDGLTAGQTLLVPDKQAIIVE